jgi:hypothetical protein
MNAAADSFVTALAATGPRPNSRRAALLLHTVSADDRSWLLAQLPLAERQVLESLIRELRKLGIPPAPELLAELGAAAPVDPAPAAMVTAFRDGCSGALDKVDPALLARTLDGEPVGLIVRLIELGPWSWTGKMLSHLDVRQRQQVNDRLAAMPREASAVGSRSPLDVQMLQSIADRVASMDRERPLTAERGGTAGSPLQFAGLPRRLQDWLGRRRSSLAIAGRQM